MKKVFLIALTLLVAIPAFSQVKFGLKAGLNITNLKMDASKVINSGSSQYTIDALSGANYGFHGGAFVRFSLLGISLQPELLFTSRTDEYTVTDLADPASAFIAKQKFNQLDLPVMLGFKLGPVRLMAGPSARLLLSSTGDVDENNDVTPVYDKFTFGYQAGIGIDIVKRITLDLRYDGSLKQYQTQIQEVTGTQVALDDRKSAILLSVGFIF